MFCGREGLEGGVGVEQGFLGTEGGGRVKYSGKGEKIGA